MDKEELINYWISSSDSDFKTMKNLYRRNDYHWSLFIGHLVKAVYIHQSGSNNPPKSHDLLLYRRNRALKQLNRKDTLDLITTFNISARYPDY